MSGHPLLFLFCDVTALSCPIEGIATFWLLCSPFGYFLFRIGDINVSLLSLTCHLKVITNLSNSPLSSHDDHIKALQPFDYRWFTPPKARAHTSAIHRPFGTLAQAGKQSRLTRPTATDLYRSHSGTAKFPGLPLRTNLLSPSVTKTSSGPYTYIGLPT